MPKVHIDLPAEIHQRMRVKAALTNQNLQAYITSLIQRDTADLAKQVTEWSRSISPVHR